MHGNAKAAIFFCLRLEMLALPLPMSPPGLVVAGLRSLCHGLGCWHPPGRPKFPVYPDAEIYVLLESDPGGTTYRDKQQPAFSRFVGLLGCDVPVGVRLHFRWDTAGPVKETRRANSHGMRLESGCTSAPGVGLWSKFIQNTR